MNPLSLEIEPGPKWLVHFSLQNKLEIVYCVIKHHPMRVGKDNIRSIDVQGKWEMVLHGTESDPVVTPVLIGKWAKDFVTNMFWQSPQLFNDTFNASLFAAADAYNAMYFKGARTIYVDKGFLEERFKWYDPTPEDMTTSLLYYHLPI